MGINNFFQQRRIFKYFLLWSVLLISISYLVGKVTAQGELERKLDTYLQVLDVVKNEYVSKNLDDQKLVYGSIRGLLQSLDDPYTRFMEPEAYKEMKIRLGGSYSGIGIYIGLRDKYITVISPIEGTPAYAAKLKSGDKILKIDDKPTQDMALEQAVSLIRGPEGSTVKLAVFREGWKDTQNFEVARAKIKIESLKFKKIEPNLAYIKLTTFENVKAAEEFEKALRKAKNSDGLIIDVRNNGGGLLQNAVEIGGMFIESGTIVQTVDREGKKEALESNGRVLWEKPVVVLINEASASASEILAGALRDNKAAKLVGTRTFGKASVQSVRPLNDGSVLLLTIAKYLTPCGEDINKKGITPDFEVLIPTKEAEALWLAGEEGKETRDPQLQKGIAVLKAML